MATTTAYVSFPWENKVRTTVAELLWLQAVRKLCKKATHACKYSLQGEDVKQSINRCIAYIPDDDGGVYAPSTVEMAILNLL